MQWFYLAISSVISFSILNLLQRKIAVDSKYPRATTMVFNIYAAIFATILFFFTGDYKNLVWPSLPVAWVFLSIAALFYAMFERGRFVAAKLLDASTLSIISNISLAIAFTGATFLYSEPLTLSKVTGVILIIISLILVSIQKNIRTKFSLKGVLVSVMVFTFLGIGWMLDKKGVIFFSPSTYSILVWVVPLVFIYFPYIKSKEIAYEARSASWKIPLLACVNVIGYYLQLQALQLADATRVIPVVQTSTLVTVILGILLLGEKEDIARKMIASVIGLIGAYFLVAI